MLTEGNFRAKPVMVSVKKSSTEKKFVAVTFRLEDGPDRGKSVDWQGWLTPKAQERTVKSLVAMGFDGENLSSCKEEVIVVLENEEYEDEEGKKHVRARVKWVNDPNRTGGFGTDLDKTELQETMSELRGLHADAKKPQGTSNASFDFGHNKEDDLSF